MTIKRSELLEFMRRHELAIEASLSPSGPQAAVVGIVVTDAFEVFFDTVDSTRKAQNLGKDPHIAFVIGGATMSDPRTVQYEGIVDQPTGAELSRLKQLYFARFPDGVTREKWKGIMYYRAKPSWLRYSDYRNDPPLIVEFTAAELAR